MYILISLAYIMHMQNILLQYNLFQSQMYGAYTARAILASVKCMF